MLSRQSVLVISMLDAGEMGKNKDLFMGLLSHTPILVSTMTPVHHRKHLQQTCECRNWTLEKWKKVAFGTVYLGKWWHRNALWDNDKTVERAILWTMFFRETMSKNSCGGKFDMCYLPTRFRPGTPLHDNGVPWWKWPILTEECTLPHCTHCSGMV